MPASTAIISARAHPAAGPGGSAAQAAGTA
jgi:hypothetical protein